MITEQQITEEVSRIREEAFQRFGKRPLFKLFYRAEEHRLRPTAIANLKQKV